MDYWISDAVLRPALTGMPFLTTSLLTDSHFCVASSSHIHKEDSFQLTQEIFACAVHTGHNASPHHVFILLDETNQFVYAIMAPHYSYSHPTAQLIH